MKKKMINTKAKIHCHTCKKDFDIYFTITNKVDFCPHCGAIVDETMRKYITDSINQVQETNQLFYKYYLEYKEPMFTISLEGLCTDDAEEDNIN